MNNGNVMYKNCVKIIICYIHYMYMNLCGVNIT